MNPITSWIVFQSCHTRVTRQVIYDARTQQPCSLPRRKPRTAGVLTPDTVLRTFPAWLGRLRRKSGPCGNSSCRKLEWATSANSPLTSCLAGPSSAHMRPEPCPVGALWVPGSNWADDATCSYLSAMKIIANLTLLHVVCFGTQYRMA